ncbi:DEHA2E04774p [Debaryomyces hansenii CBS767]|jgi:lysophospholipase|uniref:Lysophospholipase n=1 Tax=Debaryomyces hansenii (strain ATCC 36239 / CBS 767 / BCRC 21394 / JCM 1990 / NBRC 0083 / IGC 2968) TaxID=284592 RepID=Q6BQJ3_DEBHA|nr:DEHA2E04774p [Debaryomyces hansenii CBS767]CAG87754.1 DEHA2E04774p [Debaryomyces hansenii CBS767]|eukprot:XP_459527.1 DEHA2E04774p [Debaryomyces hansenii CBS767]
MKYLLLLAFLSVISIACSWSPTGGYAPGQVDCPDKSLVRAASDISDEEKEWIEGRNKITNENLIKFLENCDMKDFDAEKFVKNTSKPITIGLSFSGGGYRAMLNGAGQLSALDNRTDGASDAALGGLLQASTYLTGLSGGSWLVGTIALNNFTSVQKILKDGDIWDLEHSIVNYGGWNVLSTYNYYKSISDDLNAKEDAGFEVSLTDTWARALSHQFFAELDDFGASLTWSGIRDMDPFKKYEMPFPIVVADGRTPGTQIISSNSSVFEFNAFEMGSWDPSLYQFSDVKYIGTDVDDGESTNGTCIGGFDNAGYVLGTSSSLFNQFVLQINTTSLSETVQNIISHFLDKVSDAEDDVAIYKPNPFYKTDEAAVKSIVKNDTLYLVDGGEDLQNVPLHPLIQPQRNVDVIFAYDNSADTNESWPNGASLVATYERQFLEQGNGTIFPHVPDVNTFLNLNLTARPTFFGCDAKNLTSLLSDTSDKDSVFDSPLVVYTANRPFSYWSNTSTYKLDYEDNEKKGIIQNGYEAASRLNRTLDDEWAACVGCAIIRREQERNGIEQSDQCKSCFNKYCWNGDLDSTDQPGVNFTTTGLTDGENRISSGVSLIFGNSHQIMMSIGYALLASVVFSIAV